MDISVTHELFNKAVTAVHRAIDSQRTLPILSNLLIQTETESVLISGTDLTLGLRMQIPAEVKEPGAACLPAHKLADIAHALPDAPVRLASGSGDQDAAILLTCSRAKFSLRSAPVADFPQFPPAGAHGLTLPAKVFTDLVTRTSYAVSRDQSRYALTGIALEATPDRIRFLATDGHRLAVATAPPAGTTLPGQVIVPPKALTTAARLSLNGESDITLAYDDEQHQLLLTQAGLRINARLIDGQFPDVDSIIPTPGAEMVTLHRETLRNALRRMAPMVSEQGPVTFAPGEASVTLSASDASLGDAREELDATVQGPIAPLGLRSRYLLDFLEAVESEEVRLYITGPLSPILAVPVGSADYQYILMPMRV